MGERGIKAIRASTFFPPQCDTKITCSLHVQCTGYNAVIHNQTHLHKFITICTPISYVSSLRYVQLC